MMNPNSKVFVAGHSGLAGSAIVRNLEKNGFTNLIKARHAELDLCNEDAVKSFFTTHSPEYVFLAAAKVGGILANSTYPVDFLETNLRIQNNVIKNSYKSGVKKLMFLGSSCIYPKLCPQPIKEEYLLTGPLEPTNEWYAIAKIAGIKLCQAYRQQYGFNAICVMPTNLYGPFDNFDLKSSHVLPALIRKFVEAKKANQSSVEIWGTGSPRREFLYIDDFADACVYLMRNYDSGDLINVGTGTDISIGELAMAIKTVSKFTGELKFDTSKPDGTPQKLLNVDKLNRLGWKHTTDLETGISKTLKWYLENNKN